MLTHRAWLNIGRLHGKELSAMNHADAFFALTFIFILMITLAGLNIFYVAGQPRLRGILSCQCPDCSDVCRNVDGAELSEWFRLIRWVHRGVYPVFQVMIIQGQADGKGNSNA